MRYPLGCGAELPSNAMLNLLYCARSHVCYADDVQRTESGNMIWHSSKNVSPSSSRNVTLMRVPGFGQLMVRFDPGARTNGTLVSKVTLILHFRSSWRPRICDSNSCVGISRCGESDLRFHAKTDRGW